MESVAPTTRKRKADTSNLSIETRETQTELQIVGRVVCDFSGCQTPGCTLVEVGCPKGHHLCVRCVIGEFRSKAVVKTEHKGVPLPEPVLVTGASCLACLHGTNEDWKTCDFMIARDRSNLAPFHRWVSTCVCQPTVLCHEMSTPIFELKIVQTKSRVTWSFG
jgi:hypothetical protein